MEGDDAQEAEVVEAMSAEVAAEEAMDEEDVGDFPEDDDAEARSPSPIALRKRPPPPHSSGNTPSWNKAPRARRADIVSDGACFKATYYRYIALHAKPSLTLAPIFFFFMSQMATGARARARKVVAPAGAGALREASSAISESASGATPRPGRRGMCAGRRRRCGGEERIRRATPRRR